MIFPFVVIESKISARNQFTVAEGCQPTHALFYLKKGNFVMEIEGKTENLRAGDYVILPDYVPFRRSILEPLEFVYIKFAYNKNCPYSLNMPYGKVSFKDNSRFSASISAIETLIASDELLSAAYREHLLLDILFQIHFEQNPHGISCENRVCRDKTVNSATEYIEQNIGNKILIADVCRAAGTNASTLNFKFRRELNMSIGEFIACERMKKAKRLLLGTTYNISEIAARCGYENVYYFSNAFKKQQGVSPSEYLRNYREEQS